MKVCPDCHGCYEEAEEFCAADGASLNDHGTGGPEQVPGYRLEKLIEKRLHRSVYSSEQIECARPCLITIQPVEAELAERFVQEAEKASSFFHPNLAAVYEVGRVESGDYFVVTEELPFESLRDLLLLAEPLATDDAIRLCRQAAEAVHELHENGLVHRALRPDNILLDAESDGSPLVRIQGVDFAGVSERSIISSRFMLDSAVDWLTYFAPEQCAGSPVDARADIYSLGVILYEMLAGIPPFEAANGSGLIDKHLNARPPEVKIESFELRQLIVHALAESLHKRPDGRQANADLFARQLRHIEQIANHATTPPPAVRVSTSQGERPTRPLQGDLERAVALSPLEDVEAAEDAPTPEHHERFDPQPVVTLRSKLAAFVWKKMSQPESGLSLTQPEQVAAEEAGVNGKQDAPPSRRILSREDAAAELERQTAAVMERRAQEPRKVEWVQPEDDIPLMADTEGQGTAGKLEPEIEENRTITAVTRREIVGESRETVEPVADAVFVGTQAAQLKTGASEADVPALETEKQAEESACQRASAELTEKSLLPELISASTQVVPAAVEGSKRETAAPMEHSPDTEPMVQVSGARPIIKMRPPGIRISGLNDTSVHSEPLATEEITAAPGVSSRFRVHVDRPAPSRKKGPPERVVPIPVVEDRSLSLSPEEKPVRAAVSDAGSILSGFYPADTERTLPYGKIGAGVGILVLIGAFLSIRGSIWQSVPEAENTGVRARSAEPPAEVKSEVAAPSLPVEIESKPSYKAVEPKPAREESDKESKAAPLKTAPAKAASPAVAGATAKTEKPATKSATVSAPSRPAVKPANTGGVKAVKPGEMSKPPGKSKAAQPSRGNGATRPRIVPEAKH